MGIAKDLQDVLEFGDVPELKVFHKYIDPVFVEEALKAAGVATLRRRRLPAEQVLWLVIGMAMMRDRPITDVAARLDLVLPDARDSLIAPSALSSARARLGAKPLAWLFARTGAEWGCKSAEAHRWRGLQLFAIDGTTLRVQDTAENREYFGLVSTHSQLQSAYPVVQLVALMAVRSHLLVAASFGPNRISELTLAEELHDSLPPYSLTIMDRNFISPRSLWPIQSGKHQRHWLVRLRKNVKWTELKRYSDDDLLVERKTTSRTHEQMPELPATMQMRAIRYKPPGGEPGWLMTSLLDPVLFPAEEIAALYHERWEIELGYDEIKTEMLEHAEPLRSKTVEGVQQEIWGLLLAYNLIRLEMEQIADEAQVEPLRISFVEALRYIRSEWEWCAIGTPGSIPKKLKKLRQTIKHFILPPRRHERRYPRAVKRPKSPYPKKRRTQVAVAAK
jgi:hypothetical protein